MRIIAGTKRGMGLFSPKTDISRPITDRVKESLFSVLNNYGLPDGAVVADIFSGVGSLGLESLSRGAKFVTFIEKNQQILSMLKKNVEKAGFDQQARIIKTDAFKAGAPVIEFRYDLVFIDPPYADTVQAQENSQLYKLMDILIEQTSADSKVLVRTSKESQLLEKYSKFAAIERRCWGGMAVTIFTKTEKNE